MYNNRAKVPRFPTTIMAVHGSWTMPWASVSVSADQTEQLAAVERLCACPILSTPKSVASNDRDEGDEEDKCSLRDWYIECANEAPVEAPLVQRTVEKVEAMRRFEEQCMDFLEEVSSALLLLDTISSQHATVWTKTSSLNATCERLLAEQQQLRGTVDAMRKPLEHFNELEKLGPLLGVPITAHTDVASLEVATVAPTSIKVHPGSPHFSQVLTRIEASLLYLAKHPEFRDTALYRSKMSQLHFRALALAKIAAVDLIQTATKQAQEHRQAAPSSSSPRASSSPSSSSPRSEGAGGSVDLASSSALETGAAYGKFRGVQSRVLELTKTLSLRAAPPPAASAIEAALAAVASSKASTKNKHGRYSRNKKGREAAATAAGGNGNGGAGKGKNKHSKGKGNANGKNKNGGKGGKEAAHAAAEGIVAGGEGEEEDEHDEAAALLSLGPHVKAALASHSAGATAHAQALLQECKQVYLSARVGLLRPSVATHLARIAKEQGLLGLARQGSAYLARLCRLETRLFLSFFFAFDDEGSGGNGGNGGSGSGSGGHAVAYYQQQQGSSSGLELMLVDLCQALYASVRPFLIQQNELDSLCSVVAALHEEADAQRAWLQVEDTAQGEQRHNSKEKKEGSKSLSVVVKSTGGLAVKVPDPGGGRNGGNGNGNVGGGGGGTAAVAATLDRLVADAQERLIYLSLLVLRDEIEHFLPTDADLDYPNKLRRAFAAEHKVQQTATAQATSLADSSAAAASSSSALTLATSSNTDEDAGGVAKAVKAGGATSRGDIDSSVNSSVNVSSSQADGVVVVGHESLYASWYLPLKSTLVVLSKIYRAVDNGVFEDLAGEAVGLCTDSLRQGSLAVTVRSGGDTTVGDLFLVKHLLVLREQLTPFDVNFSQLRRRLDFSSTRQALGSFFRTATTSSPSPRGSSSNGGNGGGSGNGAGGLLRSFPGGVGAALLELAKRGLPQVDECVVDAKHDLEDALKRACTRFIAQAVSDLMDPLTTLVQLAKVFPKTNSQAQSSPPPGGGLGGGLASALDAEKIREQAFSKPQRVRECLEDVGDRCGVLPASAAAAAAGIAGGGAATAAAAAAAGDEGGGGGGGGGEKGGSPPPPSSSWSVLAVTCDKMALFLDSGVTRSILFKPIQRKVVAAVSEGRALVSLLFSSEAQLMGEFLSMLSAIEQKVLSVDLDAPPSLTPPPTNAALLQSRRHTTTATTTTTNKRSTAATIATATTTTTAATTKEHQAASPKKSSSCGGSGGNGGGVSSGKDANTPISSSSTLPPSAAASPERGDYKKGTNGHTNGGKVAAAAVSEDDFAGDGGGGTSSKKQDEEVEKKPSPSPPTAEAAAAAAAVETAEGNNADGALQKQEARAEVVDEASGEDEESNKGTAAAAAVKSASTAEADAAAAAAAADATASQRESLKKEEEPHAQQEPNKEPEQTAAEDEGPTETPKGKKKKETEEEGGTQAAAAAAASATEERSAASSPLPPQQAPHEKEPAMAESAATAATAVGSTVSGNGNGAEGDSEEAAAKAKLVAFYEKHNPSKAGEVDSTLAKFKGRYDVLFGKLNKKYGVKG